jgi:DNA-binding Lrp family transcriptional regulator
MIRAFIMAKTAAGKSTVLLDQIRATEGITEARVVAGQYDIIAEATGGEVYDVIHSVATSVCDLDGVVDTRTYICLE